MAGSRPRVISWTLVIMKWAVLLAFVASCAAQVPQPCQSPPQWEGRRVKTDPSKEYQEISKYSYDETNMRTRAIEEVSQGKERDFFDVLHLHNVRKEYRLNLKTRQCNVTDLNRPFRMRGVPPNAKFLFEAEVGAAQLPGEHITVQNWEATLPDSTEWMGAVTSPDCVPVWVGFANKEIGREIENFFDIHSGITDPSAFIPPSECLKQ